MDSPVPHMEEDMRGFAALVYAAVAIGSPCLGLRAQGTVIAETRVNLRRDSSTERTPIRVLKALERLEVTGAARNGFLPVRTERSETGWVSSDYVYPEGDEAFVAAAPPACAPKLRVRRAPRRRGPCPPSPTHGRACERPSGG